MSLKATRKIPRAKTKNRGNKVFVDQDEISLGEQFLREGYVIAPVADLEVFEKIRFAVADTAAEILSEEITNLDIFLNSIHQKIQPDELNKFRLKVIHSINTIPWFREKYFRLARPTLEKLVGNELAMQLRVNLSIQAPHDDKSLLPIHADVWSGDSPFEVVVWLPLVSCYGTKSMFILPPDADEELRSIFQDYANHGTETLFEDIRESLVWVEIKPGEVLFFNQNLPHGNRVNEESETRWSMNCRFKSLFSPYGDKKLGEFFEPITIKPATRVGLNYRFPSLGEKEA